jgi:hypothetical protein
VGHGNGRWPVIGSLFKINYVHNLIFYALFLAN